MKLKSIESLADEWVGFVRVTTECGIEGWGQVSTYNAAITVQVLHRQVAPWMLGEELDELDHVLDRVKEREHKFPGSYLRRAMAGFDTAVWDARGKEAGKPVVELLGGSPGPLRAYASSMRRDVTPDGEAGRLVRLRDAHGFDAFKIRAGAKVGRNQDEWAGRTEEIIPTVRRVLGPDVDLLIDANSCYSADRAIEIGRILEDRGYCHYEEPCPYWDLEQTRKVCRTLTIDVTGGEQDCELANWRRIVEGRVVDIVQPDILYVGGLSRALSGPDGVRQGHPGNASLRKSVHGDAVYDAFSESVAECREIPRVFDRGPGILSVAIRAFRGIPVYG